MRGMLTQPLATDQQDTKEYLNQRGTKIGVFRESKKWGVKGEVKRGKVVGKWTGLEGGKKGGGKGKRVGGKGPESTLEKLWFWYPSDLGTLY